MDELISMVSEKAGITTEQAKTAVTTVLDYLKSKLPAPVASQLDSLLGGAGSIAGGAADMVKGGVGGAVDATKSVTGAVGGLFGKG